MGLVADRNEIAWAIEQSNSGALRQTIADAERALATLENDTLLTGEAWSAAKRSAAAARVSLEKLVGALDAKDADDSTLLNAANECVGCYGEVLDEEKLKRQIDGVTLSISQLDSFASTISSDINDGPYYVEQVNQALDQQRGILSWLQQQLEALYALENATSGLYADKESGDATLDDYVTSGQSRLVDRLAAWFGLSTGDAQALAMFDIRFRILAIRHRGQDGWKTDQEIAWQYARTLASCKYEGTIWELSGGTLSKEELRTRLEEMGYPRNSNHDHPEPGSDDEFIDAMKNLMGTDDEHALAKKDPMHLMGSLACLLNPSAPLYHMGTGTPPQFRDSASVVFPDPPAETSYVEAATWGGDVATAKMPEEDMDADMDAINIADRMRAGGGTDAATSYYVELESDPTVRSAEFCRHYGDGDVEAGLAWLEQHGLESATESWGETYLAYSPAYKEKKQRKPPVSPEDQQKTMGQFVEHVRSGLPNG